MGFPNYPAVQSTLAPEALTTVAQVSTSDLMNWPNSAGEVFAGTAPNSSKARLTSGLSKPLSMAAFSFAITSGGVLAGAIRPNHDDTSKSGKPDSALVGRLGALGDRSLVVTASARSLPPCACGQAEGMLSNMNCTCPPIR